MPGRRHDARALATVQMDAVDVRGEDPDQSDGTHGHEDPQGHPMGLHDGHEERTPRWIDVGSRKGWLPSSLGRTHGSTG